MRVRPHYDEQFKESAIELLERTERSFPQVAQDLGVSEWTLRDWHKGARHNPLDDLAPEGTRSGRGASPPSGRLAAPLGPRLPIHQRRLPWRPRPTWRRREHEPQGQLLGQRCRREFLRYAQDRARLPIALDRPPGATVRSLRVHRGLLQSPATSLVAGLQDARPSRERLRSRPGGLISVNGTGGTPNQNQD